MRNFLFGLLTLFCLAIPASSQSAIKPWDGSTYRTTTTPSGWDGSTWRTGTQAWGWDGSTWRAAFSTITASASGGSGSSSGAAGSGAVSVGISSSVGGNPIGSPTFSWACVGGDCAQGINNAALQNPTISKTVGTAGCQAAANSSATWQVTQTDPATGISSPSNGVSVSLTWNNTTSCIGPFTVFASSSFNNAGQCGPSGGGRTCSYTFLGNSTATISGGPTSGSLSYSWTYVSGATGSITGNGTPSISFTSSLQSCGQQTTCTPSSVWNVHVVDTVSGYTADGQTTMSGQFDNLTG